MSTTYTINVGLGTPAHGDTGWDTALIADFALLDKLAPLGGLNVSLHETPSASLNVAVSAGTYRKANGSYATYAGTSSQGMTTATTNYIYLTDSGTLTVNTTGFPSATTLHVRLATVVAGATTITSVTDVRTVLESAGTVVTTAGLVTTGYTAGTGTAVTIDGKFTGGVGSTAYTIADMVAGLKAAGVLAS